jgi:two-component system KDP operon response regulator KdpE
MKTSTHILVIDDEPQILRALRTILTEKKFTVTTTARGEDGLALAAAIEPDLIILDLGLPDMDGIEVCSRLREWTQVPIIVLSVREGEADKVAALDKGADDYLTKPFGIEELLARIRVALRHAGSERGDQTATITAGALIIDLAWHTVTREGQPVKLTATEFNLLAYLASNAGRVLTHQSILTHVWGPADAEHTEYLRVYMRQLRKKLEAEPERPQHILTEPGIGYRFITVAQDQTPKPRAPGP